MKISSLTVSELACLERIVESGLQSFMAVGLALIEIRESQAYRLRGHETFEAYCQAAFGFTARHGRRLMSAAKTANQVAGAVGEAPRNELVARILAPVAEDVELLQSVRDRLEARGLSLSNAPGSVITQLLRRKIRSSPHEFHYVRAAHRDAGSDVCPSCGQRPHRYFYRPQEGGWICAHCNFPVRLVVSAR